MALNLDQVISDVVFWRLPCLNRGRRPTDYRDTIERVTQQEIEELQNQMNNKDSWRSVVISISIAAEE